MHTAQVQGLAAARKSTRRLAVLVVLAAALLTSAWMSFGPVSQANATINQFCWGAGVGPWGQCSAGFTRPLLMVAGKGGQHSGCVNAYHGSNLVSSWACSPTNTWTQIYYDGSRWLHGTVKNNVGVNNVLYGEMWH
jgi:hypothetical protein